MSDDLDPARVVQGPLSDVQTEYVTWSGWFNAHGADTDNAQNSSGRETRNNDQKLLDYGLQDRRYRRDTI